LSRKDGLIDSDLRSNEVFLRFVILFLVGLLYTFMVSMSMRNIIWTGLLR